MTHSNDAPENMHAVFIIDERERSNSRKNRAKLSLLKAIGRNQNRECKLEAELFVIKDNCLSKSRAVRCYKLLCNYT